MKTKKEKKKSLKKLYAELLDYIAENYSRDENLSNFALAIGYKQKEIADKKEARKLLLAEKKSEQVNIKLSISTLQLCDKLICVEKVHDTVMGINNPDIALAEAEIKQGLKGIK